MDSTELRLILLGLGIVLVIGIYAWEKSKRQRRSMRERVASGSAKPRRGGQSHRKFSLGATKETPPTEARQRQEPVLHDTAADVATSDTDAHRSVPSAPDGETGQETEASEVTASVTEDPPQVLALHVVARVGAQFSGDAIMSAVRDVGMSAGPMDIFHRSDEETGETLFSMANMVNPGTFPLHSMSEFTSPGLVLFVQLPGPKHGLVLLDELLAVADRLAALLDGRVQDENRSPLTPDKIDRLRHRLLGTR